jgi:transposase
MNKTTRYSPEIRERAVRMVFEHQAEYDSQWAAMGSIAAKIGCTAETLRKWVRRAERDQGQREGLTTSDRERLKALVVAGVKPRLFAAAMKWRNGMVASLRNVLLRFLDAKTGYRHQSQVRTG